MDNSILVSVIIPVYNVASYLVEALDSVVHQTYENLEIIVIDDGSTDGSGKMCDEYAEKDRRFRVIHQENRGLSAARNVGLDIMTGEVVAFLDSDDAFHPDFIRTMIDAMRQKSADLVVCKFVVFHTSGLMRFEGNEKEKPTIDSGEYDSITVLRALADGMINDSVWNMLYHRKLWENIRYPVGHVYEDTDTTFKIFNLCNTIYVLDQPLYLYRKRSMSITETHSPQNISDRISALFHFETFVKEHTPEIFSEEQLKKDANYG